MVTHGDISPQQNFTTGVLQGGVWSSVLFNLCIHHLPKQVSYCGMFQYADDSSL